MGQQVNQKAYDPAGKILPIILDELAANEPDRVFGELPKAPTGYDSGVRVVTFRKLANAVNGVAKWMTENMGPGRDFETISYIGPNDMGHAITVLAAIKAGYKCLLISPRYGTDGQVRLMKGTGCKNLLVSPLGDTTLRDTLAAEHGELRLWTLPYLVDLFDIEQDFPYTKTSEAGKKDPMIVLHTSGTTGFPKPIVYPLEWAVAVGRQRHPTPIPGFTALEENFIHKRFTSTMPPFHVGFLIGGLCLPFYCGSTIVYLPASMPPTAQTVAHIAQHIPFSAVSCLPTNVNELGLDPQLQETFIKAGVKDIIWGGGPAAQEPGLAASKRFNLFTTIGSSEGGLWYAIRRKAEDDSFPFGGMCFHPDENIEFRDQGDDVYLAVVVRNVDPNKLQPVFCLFPDKAEYNTKDLFRRHSGAGIDSVWHYYGRDDDLQVFPTGFKWHPGTVEDRLVDAHRDLVERALMTVSGPNVVVLLEPSTALRRQLDEAQQRGGEEAVREVYNTVVDRIWPTLDDMERNGPPAVSFDRSRVIFTEAGRPVHQTPKGTVMRGKTVKDYEYQIKATRSPAKQEFY